MTKKDKRIEVLLCGGLGNQLFQYAFGRNLALLHDYKLVLDKETLFKRDHRYRRKFELSGFRIPTEVGFSNKPRWLQSFALKQRKLTKAIRTKFRLKTNLLLDDSSSNFDPGSVHSLSPYTVCLGYWHSPDYFKTFETQIRNDLRFLKELPSELQQLCKKIQDRPSVAVHVRRADYSRVLDLDYYNQAFEFFKSELAKPNFFIFSDDPNWCKENLLTVPNTEIVSQKNCASFHEFQLMSYCNHFIIANSTFSWWAAWLGRYQHKIVAAPSSDIWIDSPSILPANWKTFPATVLKGYNW